MKVIVIILIVLIIIWLRRGESFMSGYNYVRFYRHSEEPWAVYSALDGQFLNHTFRHDINRVEYDFRHNDSYMELWGYRGAGDPKTENYGNLYANSNWDLVAMYHNKRGYVNLGANEDLINSLSDMPARGSIIPRHNYHAYKIVIIF